MLGMLTISEDKHEWAAIGRRGTLMACEQLRPLLLLSLLPIDWFHSYNRR